MVYLTLGQLGEKVAFLQDDLTLSVGHAIFIIFSISNGMVMFVPLVEIASTAYHVSSSCCGIFSMVDHCWRDLLLFPLLLMMI
jgi:hypothetical protein